MNKQVRYSDKIAETICERIGDGQTVREICADADMPAMSTVFRWLADRESFREQYARAKEAQAEYLADEITHIADDGTNDWMERHDKDGNDLGWQVNGEAIQRSKLRVDTRKWLLSKMLPKKYGDKQALEVTGEGGAPLVPVVNVSITPTES